MVRKPGVIYVLGRIVKHSGSLNIAVWQPEAVTMFERLGIIGSRVVVHFEAPSGVVSFTSRAFKEGRTAYFYIPKAIWPSFEDLHKYTGLVAIEVRG